MSVQEKMTAIADAIRAKTGGTDTLTLDAMAEAIAGIEGGGGENVFDYSSSLREQFNSVACDGADITVRFGKKSNALHANALNATAAGSSGLQSLKIIYEGSLTTGVSMNEFAHNNADIVTVDLTGIQQLPITSLNRAFRVCPKLKEILGELDLSKGTDTYFMFALTTGVQTIRIKPGTLKVSNASYSFQSLPNLTAESIQSLIDGLADLTDGTAQTLTLHATVGAKLTDAQKTAAAAKNWTLAY